MTTETEIEAEAPPVRAPESVEGGDPLSRAKTRALRADLDDYRAAVALLLEARERDPRDPRVGAELAWCYAFWGARRALNGQENRSDFRLALDEARSAVAAAPDAAEAHRALSAALARAPGVDRDERRREARRAVELNPYDGQACYEAWRAAGRDPDDPLVEKALALCPEQVGAFADLGAAFAAAGRLDEAVFSLRKALRLNPTHSLALYALAAVLRRRGDADTARRTMDAARRLHPRDALIRRGAEWAGALDPEVPAP